MDRRVQFGEFGGPEVLTIVSVQPPTAAPGEVRVRVRAASLNPLDSKIFRGLPTANPHVFELPSGNGGDFAGVIDEVGDNVTAWVVGDEVFGSKLRFAQADHVVVAEQALVAKPAGLSWVMAAALPTAGKTAWATVASLGLTAADTVLVSAAAGGVGILAAQLARRTGARVIGTASVANHDFLRDLGIEPVAYGEGLVDAVRAIAPDGITSALDNHGRASVDAALALGAPPARVNSIADYAAASDYGTTAVGAAAANSDDLAELARLLAAGEIVLPIDSVFPLERVRDAYERLIEGHVRGKIVLEL